MSPELDLRAFFETHEELPESRAIEMLFAFKAHVESGRYARLISTGKLWRARRSCDGCKEAMAAGEVRHLFRHSAEPFTFKSYFICSGCEGRWEQLGDAGVPNCLSERDNWANWKPEPIDLTRCGDCYIEFTQDTPAKGIPTTAKGHLQPLCGDCAKSWTENPNQTPGLPYTVVPLTCSTKEVTQ
jgi:hypothetical protein